MGSSDPEQVTIVGTFWYGENVDREITPEVSREKEWKFRKALITLTTVPQIHESIQRNI
jgi:hypothetical protein